MTGKDTTRQGWIFEVPLGQERYQHMIFFKRGSILNFVKWVEEEARFNLLTGGEMLNLKEIFLTKQKILGYSTPDAQAGDQGYENDS